MKRAALLAIVALTVGCPKAPKPVVFARIEATRTSAEIAPAKDGSPALWAKAEGLKKRAEEAWARGDTATAELLGDHALAAYQHAAATARLSRAIERHSKESARYEKAKEQLEADEKARVGIDAEADKLEGEIAVRREALAPVASGKTDPAREAARWIATRANLAVAEALCTGAWLLAPKAKGVEEAKKVLAEVTAKAKDEKNEAPIDASTRARSLCLKALTHARAVTVKGGGPTGDALVAELEAQKIPATRDERGVVATLSQADAKAPFEAGTAKLTAAGKERLEAIGKIAKGYPTWAIVVVVHAKTGAPNTARDASRADAVKQELAAAGADGARIAVSTPGTSLPAFDPKVAANFAKNERIEIVFVGGQ